MKKVIAILAVMILIAAASAVFAETLLTDNFNIADNSDVNADLVSRQSGTYAGTSITTAYDYGGTSEIKDGALKVSGKFLYFNQAFSNYFVLGKSITYSFKLRNTAYYGYVHISSAGNGFANGGRGFAIEENSGTSYIDCFKPAGTYNGTAVGNDGAFHQWDITITPGIGFKTVVVKKDNVQVYTVEAPDPWWYGTYVNLIAAADTVLELDDLSITGSDVALPDFGSTLLTDNFNVAGGTSNINADLSGRQTGSMATTSLAGTGTISAGGVLQVSGATVSYNNDFADWSAVGNKTHYSWRMNSLSGWTTAYISAVGNTFFNGGPGFAIEAQPSYASIDSFNEAHGWKGSYPFYFDTGAGDHKYDVYITQQTGYKDVVLLIDGIGAYTTTTVDDGWWLGGSLRLTASGSAEFDDVSISGSHVTVPDATGYVATGIKGVTGIKIRQTNGGYVRGIIGTDAEVFGVSFAANGDLYYTQGYWPGVYKAAYLGGGNWGAGALYASVPPGGGYYGAFNLSTKSDGTVFVGTYASDDIYKITPSLTVTKIVGDVPDLTGNWGWRDMNIVPEDAAGIPGDFYAIYQQQNLKNYNADGSDAGFNLNPVQDYLSVVTFAHGMLYTAADSYNTIYEIDPTDPDVRTPYITLAGFQGTTNVNDYITTGKYGPDSDGDGYGDFYFKHTIYDGRGAEWVVGPSTIEIYSGAPDLAPGDRYLGVFDDASICQFALDVWPKGTQAPIVHNYDKVNYSDDIVVDGDLSDWADATFTAMDKAYYPDPSVNLDMTNAAYSLKWGAGGTKVYLALKVQDADPVYTDWYTYWNANDHAEIQLWASGVSGTIDQNICDIAQQYEIGLQENGVDKWSYMCGSGVVPDFANLNYAITQGIDGWVFYEAAMTPFTSFSRLDVNAVVARVLAVNDVIGADAVIASKNNFADFNMIAGDQVGGKSAYTASIKKRQLIREGVMGSVVLQDFVPSPLGIAGTATITDGTSTEIHNIVLNAAGLYTFTTALRGECTVIVKCSHWLGKAAIVNVSVTGTGVVDLLSVTNGDVEENNEVDFSDINATRAAYGSFPGDETWNDRADVDGTGEVDFTDINIVRSRYGEIGE